MITLPTFYSLQSPPEAILHPYVISKSSFRLVKFSRFPPTSTLAGLRNGNWSDPTKKLVFSSQTLAHKHSRQIFLSNFIPFIRILTSTTQASQSAPSPSQAFSYQFTYSPVVLIRATFLFTYITNKIKPDTPSNSEQSNNDTHNDCYSRYINK